MSRFLEDFREFMKSQSFEITRISEYHDGKIETDEYTPANPCQDIYSVAKSFVMTAIGLLYDKKLLSLDEKICDIFADEWPENADERWKLNTIEMALTHRIGVPGGFLDIDVNKSSVFGKNYLEYMLTYPLDYTPGTDSKYSDGAYYLLARIVEKKTGMEVDDFLWEELFYKMDFQEMAWSHCPMGHVMGATGLYIHSSDMVKLGALYLNGGKYNGEQLLSKEWAELAPEKCFAFDWDDDHELYHKGGMCGQRLIVAPKQNRVVGVESFGGNSNIILDWVIQYKD